MKNGDIIFKDLTEQYICGNGILNLNKGSWKIHHEKHLILTISGEYAFESAFEKELEYEIVPSKENELSLKLIHLLKSCFESFGGTIYVDLLPSHHPIPQTQHPVIAEERNNNMKNIGHHHATACPESFRDCKCKAFTNTPTPASFIKNL